jgi:hypothetical protein
MTLVYIIPTMSSLMILPSSPFPKHRPRFIFFYAERNRDARTYGIYRAQWFWYATDDSKHWRVHKIYEITIGRMWRDAMRRRRTGAVSSWPTRLKTGSPPWQGSGRSSLAPTYVRSRTRPHSEARALKAIEVMDQYRKGIGYPFFSAKWHFYPLLFLRIFILFF